MENYENLSEQERMMFAVSVGHAILAASDRYADVVLEKKVRNRTVRTKRSAVTGKFVGKSAVVRNPKTMRNR